MAAVRLSKKYDAIELFLQIIFVGRANLLCCVLRIFIRHYGAVIVAAIHCQMTFIYDRAERPGKETLAQIRIIVAVAQDLDGSGMSERIGMGTATTTSR